MTITYDFEKIWKKIPKIFRILGVVTDLQVDFLNEHQLLATFCDLILINQVKTFNLSHMTTLMSIDAKNYYVITKFLWRNRKFPGQKLFSKNF